MNAPRCWWMVLALVVLPQSAQAFVCTRVLDSKGEENGPSLAWTRRDLRFALHAQGTADIAGTAELEVLRNSFAQWGRLVKNGVPQGDAPTETANDCVNQNSCRTTDLTFTEITPLSTRDRVGYDFLNPDNNENLLIFRDGGWPMADQASVIALTTTTYNALTGEILDADIEYNSSGFHFTIGDVGIKSDLMNTTVHEIGHILGLAHNNADPQVTMYYVAGDGEYKKRDLAPDDRNGVVFKYPAGQPNGYCDPTADPDCGCPPPGKLNAVPTLVVKNLGDGPANGCAATQGAVWVLLAVLGVGVWRRGSRR
jgi:hypothetical protein